ncbi:hypothetical protein ACIGXM_21195 [Kitasatospora sp. NPDC052896]|uniref:hypothetical protein n=1 Tax=Kitasatospora sp. NPDC052896 TaxID=3364061 RepID=UPI0037CC9F47
MTAVDAMELLERIRKARDWAESEHKRFDTMANDGSVEGGLPPLFLAAAHLVVRCALDEILEPGSNSAAEPDGG